MPIEIINAGGPSDRQSIGLETRLGRRIRNERMLQQAPDARRRHQEALARDHPEARCRSTDSTYNCMGMVFASRRTAIDPVEFRLIVEDDGYEELREERPEVGDLVVYRQPSGSVAHVGQIVEVSSNLMQGEFELMVLSKWGKSGEYIHGARDYPAGWEVDGVLAISVWSERRRGG